MRLQNNSHWRTWYITRCLNSHRRRWMRVRGSNLSKRKFWQTRFRQTRPPPTHVSMWMISHRDSVVWSFRWGQSWEGLLLVVVTDVSTTWAEVITSQVNSCCQAVGCFQGLFTFRAVISMFMFFDWRFSWGSRSNIDCLIERMNYMLSFARVS